MQSMMREEISRSSMLFYTFLLVFGIFMILIAAMDCVSSDSGIYFMLGILVLLLLPIFMFITYKPFDTLPKSSKTNLMILCLIVLVSCIFFIVIAAKGCGKNTAAFYGIGIVWMLISAGCLFLLNQDGILGGLNRVGNLMQGYSAAPPAPQAQYAPAPQAQYAPAPAPQAQYAPAPAPLLGPAPQQPVLSGGYDNLTTTGTLGTTSAQQGGMTNRTFRCASWL